MARDCHAAIVCCEVLSPLELALERNAYRTGHMRLDDEVVTRLHRLYEPLCKKRTAEKFSITIINDKSQSSIPYIRDQVQAIHELCSKASRAQKLLLEASSAITNEQCLKQGVVRGNLQIKMSESIQKLDLALRRRVGTASILYSLVSQHIQVVYI